MTDDELQQLDRHVEQLVAGWSLKPTPEQLERLRRLWNQPRKSETPGDENGGLGFASPQPYEKDDVSAA